MQNEDGNISPLRAFFRQKWVRATLIGDAIFLLIVIGILIWQATKVSTINFNVAPIDATISVNGNTSYENGQYAITPGTYEIKISHEGLEEKTFNVDIAPHYVVSISTFLKGTDNNFDFYELKENYESYQKLASIASAENNITTDQDTSAEGFITNFQKNYELYQTELPINYTVYKEDPDNKAKTYLEKDITIKAANNDIECKKTLCIKALMVLTDDKNLIASLLQEKNMDIKDYEIIYKIY